MSSRINNYPRCATLTVISTSLMQCRNDYATQRLLTSVAIQILEFYVMKPEVRNWSLDCLTV
jgi:hypothetical protein